MEIQRRSRAPCRGRVAVHSDMEWLLPPKRFAVAAGRGLA